MSQLELDTQIWGAFTNDTSITEIASMFAISVGEAQASIIRTRAGMPKLDDEEMRTEIERQLLEEITRLRRYRDEAAHGYKELETIVKHEPGLEENVSQTKRSNRKNFSAVASLTKNIVECLRFIGGMRGIVKPDVSSSDLKELMEMLGQTNIMVVG